MCGYADMRMKNDMQMCGYADVRMKKINELN